MAGDKNDKQIHTGHRRRMHERVQKYGLESLAEHEVLEYLLYFTNARRDTNRTAHALLERFGDLAGVLEASEEELCQVEGMGPVSARLLHLMPQVSSCYHRSRENDARRLRTLEQTTRYLARRFCGVRVEQVLLICLDRQRRILSADWLGEGGRDEVDLPVHAAIAQAVRMRARYAVLAHNHPSGDALPSRQDLEATAEIARGMYLVGIELLDHFIVTDSECLSLRQRSEVPDGALEHLRIFAPRE